MSQSVQCPGCQKQYPLKPELSGKKVKCTGCGSTFEIPAIVGAAQPAEEMKPLKSGLDDLFAEEFGSGAATAAPSPKPATPRTPGGHPPQPASAGPTTPFGQGPLDAGPAYGVQLPRRKKNAEMTESDRGILKFGIGVAVFGILAMLLPLAGLQFKVLNVPGIETAVPYIALVLCLGGGALTFYALRGNLAMGGGCFAGIAGAGLVVLAITTWVGPGGQQGGPVAAGGNPPAPVQPSLPGTPAAASAAAEAERVSREWLGNFNDLCAAMQSVRDETSARLALPRVQSLVRRAKDLQRQLESAGSRLSKQDDDRLAAQYVPQMEAAGKRLESEATRLQNVQGALPILQSIASMDDKTPGPHVPGPVSPFPGGTPSRTPEQARQDIIQKYGADKVVTFEIRGMPQGLDATVSKRLSACAGNPRESFGQGSAGRATKTAGPVTLDLQAIADKIDFARSVKVDRAARTITIDVDPAKLPPPPGQVVSDPNDPRFYKHNLADLKGDDAFRRHDAVKRLKGSEPKELRAEILAAMREVARSGEHFERQDAIEALGRWGGVEIVPDLIALVDDSDVFVSGKAITALAAFPDPPVAEAVARKLTERGEAREALKKMGPAAEDAVLKLLDAGDERTTPEACKLLAEIGTQKSLEKLKELARSENFFIRSAADDAVHKVAARPVGPTMPGPKTGTDPAKPAPKSTAGDPVAQALLDLDLSEDRGKEAAERLSRMKVDEARRAEVSAALVKLLATAQSDWTIVPAVKALAVWHAPDALPEMLKTLDHQSHGVRWPAMEALSKVKQPSVAKAVAARLLENSDRGGASKALAAMGPVAEDAVLDYIDNPEMWVRVEAVKILGQIGTKKKSLPKLSRLARDKEFFVKNAAADAVRAINARRDPVDKDGK